MALDEYGQLARKRLSDMAAQPVNIYAPGTPTVAAQDRMNTVAGKMLGAQGQAAKNIMGFGPASAGLDFVQNNSAQAKSDRANIAALDSSTQLSREAQRGINKTPSNIPNAAQSIAAPSMPRPSGGFNQDNPSLSQDIGQSVFKSRNNSIFQPEMNVINPDAFRARQALSQPRQQIAGVYDPNGGGGAIPDQGPGYKRGQGGSYDTNSGLNVTFDSSVPIDRQKAFLAGPPESGYVRQKAQQIAQPSQVQQFQPSLTLPAPVSHEVGPLNTFTDIMRAKATQKQDRQDNASNANNAQTAINAYNAEATAAHGSAALGSAQDIARMQSQTQFGVAGMNAQSAQDVARMNQNSLVNQAQSENLQAQTGLHQQQAEQAKVLNDLNMELTNPKTTPERQQQILQALGKEKAPAVVHWQQASPDGMTKIDKALVQQGQKWVDPETLANGAQGVGVAPPKPSPEALSYLKNNAKKDPKLLEHFKQMYGYLPPGY